MSLTILASPLRNLLLLSTPRNASTQLQLYTHTAVHTHTHAHIAVHTHTAVHIVYTHTHTQLYTLARSFPHSHTYMDVHVAPPATLHAGSYVYDNFYQAPVDWLVDDYGWDLGL